jgi:oligopeptidase B
MKNLIAFIILVAIFSCKNQDNKNQNTQKSDQSTLYEKTLLLEAPVAKVIESKLQKHGDTRIDNYYWMKLSDAQKEAKEQDQQTKDVLDYLKAENDYLDTVMSHTKDFQASLYTEIVSRIKQTDMSVPYKDNGYFYITKYDDGKEYPIISRKKEIIEAPEEILVDENERAEGHKYYASGGYNVSPNNKILAFGEDVLSRRKYTIRFKDLATGAFLKDEILNTEGSVTWANDNQTVFYSIKDEALRSFKIMKHVIGKDPKSDKEVFHEKDESFSTFVYKTKSHKFIVIGSYATLSQEFRFLDGSKPDDSFAVFQAREAGLEYSIDHYEDKWFIRTNKDGAKNFKIMSTSLSKTSKEHWKDFVEHRADVLIEGFEIFKKYFVLSERVKGIVQIKIMPWEGQPHTIDFGQDAYTVYTMNNNDFDTDLLRLGFTSMTTPSTTYDYHMSDKKLTLLKQQEVIGGFKEGDYASERLFAKAKDGKEIPISLVYKKGFRKKWSGTTATLCLWFLWL